VYKMLKEEHRTTGTVKWYDRRKGFGFIEPDKSDEDVFVHRTALQSHEDANIVEGEKVTFLIKDNKKGPAAIQVKRATHQQRSRQSEHANIDDYFPGFEAKRMNELDEPSRPQQGDNDVEFADLDLNEQLLRGVKEAGYEKPTPIQAEAIPIVLKGKDVLGCAQTGTGKTAAFALPTLQRLGNGSRLKNQHKRRIKVLIVAPTRELAIQIKDSFNTYGKHTGLKAMVIYGGVGQNPQVKKLRQGVDIVAATPGRLIDLMKQGHVDLSNVEVLILDEGDRMLDMGFIHDIRYIVQRTPKKGRQTLLFSATIPREVLEFANDILRNPVKINISPEEPTLDIIRQGVFFVSKSKKQALLEYLLADRSVTRALVFKRTKHSANRVVRKLKRKGIRAEPIHGNKSQSARQRALKNFRNGKTRVLVATDVAARGIDVDDISHVIQFDLPYVPKTYLHRIGRTGRAGAGGTALAFCDGKERKQLKKIEKIIKMRVKVIQDHPYN
jgi:ATP-dependent RNA helicase RhlE